MDYAIAKQVEYAVPEAVKKIKAKLREQGFGILTEIDLKQKLEEKLGIDYEDYVILGVCNPNLSYGMLEKDKNIGVFLPCNIVVYSSNGKTIISAADPVVLLQPIHDSDVLDIAKEAKDRLTGVIDAV